MHNMHGLFSALTVLQFYLTYNSSFTISCLAMNSNLSLLKINLFLEHNFIIKS